MSEFCNLGGANIHLSRLLMDVADLTNQLTTLNTLCCIMFYLYSVFADYYPLFYSASYDRLVPYLSDLINSFVGSQTPSSFYQCNITWLCLLVALRGHIYSQQIGIRYFVQIVDIAKDGRVMIDKFDGSDFEFWRMQVEDLLYQNKLHERLSKTKPEDMKEDVWLLLDRWALGVVRLTLE